MRKLQIIYAFKKLPDKKNSFHIIYLKILKVGSEDFSFEILKF